MSSPPKRRRGNLRNVGRLVAIEGLDGAGKRTLAAELTQAWRATGAHVAALAFPRYGVNVHADLVREALHGQHGDLGDSVYGMALLYALDRFQARAEIERLAAEHDVVLLDRYVSSNAAYQAARLGESTDGDVVRWIRELEIDRFGLPVPHAQVLLSVPVDVAAERARGRAVTESGRCRDAFESDDELQRRCAVSYERLAERNWLSPWHRVDGVGDLDAAELVKMIDAA